MWFFSTLSRFILPLNCPFSHLWLCTRYWPLSIWVSWFYHMDVAKYRKQHQCKLMKSIDVICFKPFAIINAIWRSHCMKCYFLLNPHLSYHIGLKIWQRHLMLYFALKIIFATNDLAKQGLMNEIEEVHILQSIRAHITSRVI